MIVGESAMRRQCAQYVISLLSYQQKMKAHEGCQDMEWQCLHNRHENKGGLSFGEKLSPVKQILWGAQ